MRKVLFTACCLLPACTQVDPPAVPEIVQRHVEARGGPAALDAILNLRVRVEIVEPDFTVQGDYRASEDGRMRIDVFMGDERVFSEGLDAKGAWQRPGGAVPIVPASPEGAAALKTGVEFNIIGFHRFAERGHRLESAGRERIGGVDYEVLKVRLANGYETTLYFNAETSMLERRRERRALHPDTDPAKTTIETVFSDFAPLCGVVTSRASKQVDLETGATLQTSRLLKQECNLAEGELEIDRDAD